VNLARRTLLPLGAIAAVVVAATGVWLTFEYRPTVNTLAGIVPGDGDNTTKILGTVHLVAATVLGIVVVVGAALALIAVARRTVARRPLVATIAVLAPLGMIVGYDTGLTLPWQYVALRYVTVGDEIKGVFFPDGIKYVFTDIEISPGTYATQVWLHVCVIPLILIAAGIGALFLWSAARRSASAGSVSASEGRPDDWVSAPGRCTWSTSSRATPPAR
jgi:hypothetical protein